MDAFFPDLQLRKTWLRLAERDAQGARAEFWKSLPALRGKVPDRAILRAIHFFEENARVDRQVAALRADDLPAFLEAITESGRSSYFTQPRMAVNCFRAVSCAFFRAGRPVFRGSGPLPTHC